MALQFQVPNGHASNLQALAMATLGATGGSFAHTLNSMTSGLDYARSRPCVHV